MLYLYGMEQNFTYAQECATHLAESYGQSYDAHLLTENIKDIVQQLQPGDSAVCAYAGRKFKFTYRGPNDYVLCFVGGQTFMNVIAIQKA